MPSEIERSSLSITSSFGPGLKAVREALSLTQTATARSASITKNCLNMLERGTGSRLETVVAVLAVHGAAMKVMREELQIPALAVATRAHIASPILDLIEAGLCLDVVAMLQVANVYRTMAGDAQQRQRQQRHAS